jgi:signal transduction histidine kinase
MIGRYLDRFAGVRDGATGERSSSVLRCILIATLLPPATYALEQLIWPVLSPYAWLLFFPTVLLAAWLGNFWSGIGATVISTSLVVWRFIPPERSLHVASPKFLLSPVIFMVIGFVVSYFQERLKRANRELRDAHRQERFLAHAGALLAAATLDYEETLTSIARLASREFADFCFIDLLEKNGELRRLRAWSRDPSLKWACEVLTNSVIDRNQPHLTEEALRTKLPILIERLLPQQIEPFAQDNPERLRALRAMEPKSVITVPLVARGQSIGALAFVSSKASRPFDAEDLRSAEALALRAALSIDNARLYQANQRALRARDEVLGVVAHDLRNPLNAVSLEAEILARGRRAHAKESVVSIRRSAQRMNGMIQDLLDTARLEAGGIEGVRSSVPASELIFDAVDAQRLIAAKAGLELRVEVPQNLPELWADRERLLRVFDNLIGNALKFTAPGGHITIGAVPKGNEVQVWVADTGVGISKDDLPNVFKRFWQAPNAERRGAGLGLSIVKGIVEAHDGRIWVDSVLGTGTTFFFTIPVAIQIEAGRSEGAGESAGRSQTTRDRGMRPTRETEIIEAG